VRHVYLHVPFCRRRCSYCDFSIAVRRTIPAAQYVEAILCEHTLLRAAGEWDGEALDTLYLGGGTPSLLSPDAVADLVRHFLLPPAPFRAAEGEAPPTSLDRLERDGPAGVEVTIEVNPDDVTAASAEAWRAAGVNRVSLGVQSFDPAVLRWMHRTHDAAQAPRAMGILRRAGFDNVSLDLIFALPDAVKPDFQQDLEQALAIEPDHLSLYGLSVEPRTPLARWTSRGALLPTGEERYTREFLLAHARLTRAGFEHYEVSNYARAGCRARHNAAYWTGAPYAGLGPSAHAYAGGVRRWNVAPWAAYQRRVSRGRTPEEGREVLGQEERRLEAVYLGLRTCDGVDVSLIPASRSGVLDEAARNGLLEVSGRRVRATPRGWLTLDGLVARLTT
jgi:oxygen-independent coproporphyrinogen-3 oxidase